MFHGPNAIGKEGIDALEGLPLKALAKHLHAIGSDTFGSDNAEMFERK